MAQRETRVKRRKIKVNCQHKTKVALSRKGSIRHSYEELILHCFNISVLWHFVFVFLAFENEGINNVHQFFDR